MPAISYNLITRNAPDELHKSLVSIYETLYMPGDETIVVDTGSGPEELQKNREVVGEFADARLIERPDLTEPMKDKAELWIPDHVHLVPDKTMRDFSAARKVAYDLSKNPVVYWHDTDDVLTDPSQSLRKFVNQVLTPENPRVGAVFLVYLYAFDKHGQCTAELKRERFVLKDRFYWVGRCHETLCPTGEILPSTFYEHAQVVHTRKNEDQIALRTADARNYLILKTEINETAPNIDPRTMYYFANACRGLSRFYEAIKWYRKFIPLSGSRSDQWSAWYFQGNMYMSPQMKRPLDGLKCFFECLKVNPTDPLGYFGCARAYAELQRWWESLCWYRYGELNTPKKELHCVDPTQLFYHPKLCAAQCCIKLKRYVQAQEFIDAALEWKQTQIPQVPPDDPAMQLRNEIHNLLAGEELSKGMAAVARNLETGGLPNVLRVSRKICSELHAIPPDLEECGIAKPEPPDRRDPSRPSVAIWTGQTAEQWDHTSGETGIGGSEKMVILLAPLLQKRGCNVTVYANMSHQHRGLDLKTNVVWRHWAEYDTQRPRDVLIVWRAPQALTALQGPVKKRVFWGHDVLNRANFTPEIQAVADLYQVQSEFHARPLRGLVPDEKIWVARNGIVPVTDDLENDPYTAIYTSSPDRGLLTAAQMVQRAQRTEPRIKLVCCYGMTPLSRKVRAQSQYGHIPDLGRDVNADMYELWLHETLDEVQAVVLNRVGFSQVAEAFKKAGVWLYPTRFPEISCMSAMEAMASGCVPVCTNTGALEETLTRGGGDLFKDVRLPGEPDIAEGAEALLRAVKVASDDPRRVKMSEQANAAFDVNALADEWCKKLELPWPTQSER